MSGNTTSSFYSSTPNYATTYPTQNDTNTEPTPGDTPAKSSFYPNGGDYAVLENSDTFLAAVTAEATAAQAAATAAAASAASVGSAGSATPLMDGTATAGSSSNYSRQDHVHPTDTSRAPLASPTFTGTPAAPTPANADNSTKIATTAWVNANTSGGITLGSGTPLMDGTAAAGTATTASHQDHVHPSDTTRAPLASPTFTGTPAAPTASQGNNSTQLATTAYADTGLALKAPLASPTFTGTPAAPTATVGTNTTQLATTAFVAAAVATPALSKITAALGADVALNTSTFTDGPSIAQGTSGTWFVSGSVTMYDTAGANSVYVKLWDGTTVIAAAYVTCNAANFGTCVSLSGYLTAPAGNLRISAKSVTTSTSKMVFNATGTSKDCTISAIRIG
jgi:hypothetical protein